MEQIRGFSCTCQQQFVTGISKADEGPRALAPSVCHDNWTQHPPCANAPHPQMLGEAKRINSILLQEQPV